jgi:hypothetical protein
VTLAVETYSHSFRWALVEHLVKISEDQGTRDAKGVVIRNFGKR